MKFLRAAISAAILVLTSVAVAGELTIPNIFHADTPAIASEVNGNFTAVDTAVDDNAADISALQMQVTQILLDVAANGSNITQLQNDLSTANIAILQLMNAVPQLESVTYYADGLFFVTTSGTFVIANVSSTPTGFNYFALPGLDPVTISVANDNTTVLLQAQGEAYLTDFSAVSILDVALTIDGVIPSLGAEVSNYLVSDNNISTGGAHWDILYPVVLNAGNHTIGVQVRTDASAQGSITIDARDGRAKLVVTQLVTP